MQMQSTGSSISPFNLKLYAPITPADWISIARRLWGSSSSATTEPAYTEWVSYIAYYTRECERASSMDHGIHLAAKTHGDIAAIADILRSNLDSDATRQEFSRLLEPQHTPAAEDALIKGSLKLVARLLTMVDTGSLSNEYSSHKSLHWAGGLLKTCIHDHFNDVSRTDFEDPMLGSDLAVRNIHRMTKNKIMMKPTDNLLDHLRLVENNRKVCVFHHISFLRYMKAINSPMFPDGFIDETINTLILLLPSNKKTDKRWMRQYLQASSHSMPLDRGLLETGFLRSKDPSRDLNHYIFWRERLGMLKEAVEHVTPPREAFKKALRNSKGEGWINSWIGVVAIGLTLFFGLVQSIEGAIQVYKAYH